MGLRYSEIVGEKFYQIKLHQGARDMCDVHFTGAAHHLIRMRQANDDPAAFAFHLRLHRAHLRQLRSVVYECGDFSEATDESFCGNNNRESWNPAYIEMPDPSMFNSMQPDPRHGIGEGHHNDSYLPKDEDDHTRH